MGVYHVNGPNGEVYEVTAPDDATQEQVIAFARANAKPAAAPQPKPAQPQPKRSLGQDVTGFMANVNRGLGVGDELAAGMQTAGNLFSGKLNVGPKVANGQIQPNGQGFDQAIVNDFKANMGRQRQTEDSYTAAHPNLASLGKGTGMAATVALPAGNTANLFAQGSRVANAARGAVTAGLQGAAYAAADRGTLAERAGSAAQAARDPVTLGLGATAGAMATRRPVMQKPPPAKDLDQLRTAKQAAYAAADQAGVRYAPQAFDGLINTMGARLQRERVNPMRHPKAASMLEDIQAMKGQSPTLTELDQLRQVISSDVAGAVDNSERRLGRALMDELDQFVGKAGPQDVIAGSAPEAAQLITNARDLNTRFRKVESVVGATEKARLRAGSTGSGGNADNATRQELRRVLERGKNFTGEERQALETIVLGGKGQNLLRLVGKLSPSGNGLMAAGNLTAAALGGPLGAVPGAAGIASKLAADGITRQKVAQLIELMSRGGASAKPVATGLTASRVSGPAAARLSRAAGVAGGAQAAQPANLFAQP